MAVVKRGRCDDGNYYATNDEGVPETVGTITWDGKTMTPNPANVLLLNGIAMELMKQPDPVAAMKTLPKIYDSMYLLAEIS